MADWTLRPATTRDTETLAACIDAAYDTYREQIADLPAVSDGVADHIQNDHVWVAVGGQRIIGGVILMLGDGYATLANVAVHPSAAGQGLGRALIQRAEDHARATGRTELRLVTHVNMPGNIRLYDRLGWQETGRSGNKVMFSKQLAPPLDPPGAT